MTSHTKFPIGPITIGILLVVACLIFALWQQPPQKEMAPGSASQTGNVTSAGQSGGVTTGLYINNAPPVTDQQKAEALASLQAEIQELSAFPNHPDVPEPRTLLEQVSINKSAHRLYVILEKYYRPTITGVPYIGVNLYKFKVDYYNFVNADLNFESKVTTQIGKDVGVPFRAAWGIYFRYFLLRSVGLSQQAVMDGGNFLNYGITWDDAEKIYEKLHADPAIAQSMADNASSFENLISMASKLLKESNGH